MRKTHKERVMEYIKEFGSITSLEAFRDLGNTRLSATVFSLRQDGIPIARIDVSSMNRYGDLTTYGRYYLIGSEFDKKLKEKSKNVSK